nr:uncharacterized protein LOC118681452 isoform X1 [Bactrocera oleae]
MDHILPPDPQTHFMRKVLYEIEDDCAETSSELEYDFSREEVDDLVQQYMDESEAKYKQREAMFCESQLAKSENQPKKLRRNLPNNEESDNADSDNDEDSFAVSEINESFNDDDYFADAELNDLSGLDDDNSTLDCLERRIHSRQTKQKIKTTRKTRTNQLAFLSQRIHFSLREIFNARQFIKQAEDEIKENGGDNLNAMIRARETYYNLHRVISDETIQECIAVTKGIKTKEAKEFDAEIHPPSVFQWQE